MLQEVAMWLFRSLIFMLPPYVANASPLVFSKIIKPCHPLDFGLFFVDGRRILGDGKTVEGFIVGVAAGTLVGAALVVFHLHSLTSSFVLSLGALTGDALGSFVKRRLCFKRGEHAVFLDELPFIITAFALHTVLVTSVTPDLWLAALIITPPLHIATNRIAEVIGVRKNKA